MENKLWKGTEKEFDDLKSAIKRNTEGSACNPCSENCPHRILSNERVLDHLLYVRRIHIKIQSIEFQSIVSQVPSTITGLLK